MCCFNVQAGDYNTNASTVGSYENPARGEVNATGQVIATPLNIYPPTGFVPEVDMGNIHPGETLNYTPLSEFNTAAFTVTGQPTYNVRIRGDIETEEDGLTIVPEWYIGDNFFNKILMPGISGDFAYDRVISGYGGFMIMFTIKSMTAAPGARVGKRIFEFKLECSYYEISP